MRFAPLLGSGAGLKTGVPSPAVPSLLVGTAPRGAPCGSSGFFRFAALSRSGAGLKTGVPSPAVPSLLVGTAPRGAPCGSFGVLPFRDAAVERCAPCRARALFPVGDGSFAAFGRDAGVNTGVPSGPRAPSPSA